MSNFVEKCKKELNGKDLDYKIEFAENLLLTKKISLESAIELLNYIFDKDSILKRQAEKDELYDISFHCCNSRQRGSEYIQNYIDYIEFDDIYFRDIEVMENKRNKWLGERL
jgi:hypothetical protein